MTFYWRIRDIPELADVPPAARRARWRQARRHMRRTDSAPAAALTAGAVFAVVYVACVVIAPRAAALDLLLTVLVTAVVTLAIQRWRQQPAARAWLREHPGRD